MLQFVRTEDAKRKEKAKKLERATKELQEKKAILDAKQKAEAVIVNATRRLKEL